jgi:hypothetical protein
MAGTYPSGIGWISNFFISISGLWESLPVLGQSTSKQKEKKQNKMELRLQIINMK